jgi:hypothetical protein
MKKTDVERFEKVTGQLEGIYEEITSLSKRAPNAQAAENLRSGGNKPLVRPCLPRSKLQSMVRWRIQSAYCGWKMMIAHKSNS